MSCKPPPHILWEPLCSQSESDCACPDVSTGAVVLRSPVAEWPESDCACAISNTTLTTVRRTGTLWQLPRGLHRASLPKNHELVFSPIGPAGVVVLNEPAKHILDSFASPHHLSGPTDSQLAALRLIQPISTGLEPETYRSDTLTAWLHVTDRCNLRCSYCYVDKSSEAMSETTGIAAVDTLFRSAVSNGFRVIKLKYAGGEPTLNFGLVRFLHRYAQTLARDYGLVLREVLLSNGVSLTDEMLIDLREMDMRLAISLDGVGATHDEQRGQGTFAQVNRSIDRAVALGLQPHISVTVTSRNVYGLPDVMSYILDRGLMFNLNFYRPHVHLGSKNSLRVETELLIERVRAGLAVVEERLPHQSLVGGLLDRVHFGHPHTRPCGAGRSYVVIDCGGRISVCQMEMDRVVGTIWEDDPVLAVRSAKGGFRNQEVNAREECSSCNWRYWCAGGCPLLTYRLTGRNDTRSPYCETYLALFPDLLRLEGLRLLKWASPIN